MTIQGQYYLLHKELNERHWRLFLATEASKIGYGGISRVASVSGSDWKTIKRGIDELGSEEKLPDDRIRKFGGGRKKIVDQDTALLSDLDRLIVKKDKNGNPPRGNPMRFLQWTDKSVAHLAKGLQKMGHHIHDTALFNLMHRLHYSLRSNKKDDEGESSEDRNQQFTHINQECETFEKVGNPIISVDCKKKEKLGNFRNNGREWQKKGKEHDTKVNTYDFWSLVRGVVNPYGIYDVLQKQGFVNVGIDHDTASFAVESIRRWWRGYGKVNYPHASGILVTADGGGSNGVRNRLFKVELQQLVNEIGIPITLCHYPKGTSKWNVIEHQLFSFISINWRARPLTSLAVVLELISHTTTKSGLTVKAVVDTNTYQTGIKIKDQEFNLLNIERYKFHPEWNYTILTQKSY